MARPKRHLEDDLEVPAYCCAPPSKKMYLKSNLNPNAPVFVPGSPVFGSIASPITTSAAASTSNFRRANRSRNKATDSDFEFGVTTISTATDTRSRSRRRSTALSSLSYRLPSSTPSIPSPRHVTRRRSVLRTTPIMESATNSPLLRNSDTIREAENNDTISNWTVSSITPLRNSYTIREVASYDENNETMNDLTVSSLNFDFNSSSPSPNVFSTPTVVSTSESRTTYSQLKKRKNITASRLSNNKRNAAKILKGADATSRTQLINFMNEKDIAADFEYSSEGPDHSRIHQAVLCFDLPECNGQLKGIGIGKTKKLAAQSCSLNMVKQLFNFGFVKAANLYSSPVSKAASPSTRLLSSMEQAIQKNQDLCIICCRIHPEITFKPCGHTIVCKECGEDCKFCLKCDKTIQHKSKKADATESKPDESSLCQICFEHKYDSVFLCGHVACGTCCKSLKKCHMCRKPITKVIKMFV